MQALQLLVSIPQLNPEAILAILSEYPLDEVYKIRQLLDKRLTNDTKTVYIILNKTYGGFDISEIFEVFVKKYRDILYTEQLNREDPILVISYLLFGQQISHTHSSLVVRTEYILPHQYFRLNDRDGMESLSLEEFDHENKEGSNYCRYFMSRGGNSEPRRKFKKTPERPLDLFAALQDFAQKNNVTMNIEYALSILPQEGRYRLYD